MQALSEAFQADRTTRSRARWVWIQAWVASFGALAMLLSSAMAASRVPDGGIAPIGPVGQWTSYSNVDHVRAIAVESIGGAPRYAWIATDGGAACWDLQTAACISFTTANGLLSNNVLCVSVDHQGRKWFGTDAGVSVLVQGYATPWNLQDDIWRHYDRADGLISERVQAIAFSRNVVGVELAWLGSVGGVTVLEESPGGALQTRNYSPWDGLTGNEVTSIAISNTSEVWCGTNGGITVLSGPDPVVSATLTAYTTLDVPLASNRVQQITCRAGVVWVATDGGLCQRDATGRWFKEPFKPDAENKLPCAAVFSVDVDARGNAWLVLGNGQVTVVRAVDAWPIYSSADGLPAAGAKVVAFDGQGRMLLGTLGGGMLALDPGDDPYDKADDRWNIYRSRLGPASNVVTALAVHRGALVCGMWNYGVSANDTSGWHHYAFGNGPMSNNVTAVAIDSSELKWFATQSSLREGMPGGVSVMDDQVQLPAWATYAYSDVLPLAYSYALATSANQVWVGTDEGAVLLDHQGNALDPAHAVCITYTLGGLLTCAPTHPITVGRDITVVQAVAIEPAASRVWFGTTRGLVYLDTGGTPFSRSDDHWCAFIGTDLITGTDVPTVTYAVTALVSSCIYDVALDDAGHVWLATARGLSVLDLQGTPLNPRDDQWQSFMSDVTIRSLARDRDGCWWLATPLGAVRFCDGGTPFVTMDDTWQIFTTADGLAGNDVYAIRVDAVTGHVWFGTDHGVSELVPASLLPTPTQTRMGTITVVPTLRASATPTLQASATPSVTATSPTVTLTGTPTSTFVQTVTPTGTRSVPETPSVTPTLGVTPMGHKLYLPSVSRAEGHLYLPLVRRGTPS